MKLRFYILLLLLLFGLAPLIIAVLINLPLVLDRTAMFYQKAYLQNLRADFRDLDQHLASRDEMIRLLAKLPEPGVILGQRGSEDEVDRARARYTGWINQVLPDQLDVIQILFLDAAGNERFWLRRDAQTSEWEPAPLPPEPPSRGFVNAGIKLNSGEVIVSRIRINPYAGSEDPRKLMTLQLASPVGERGGADGLPPGLLLMTIDVGGLAQYYRDTLWVTNDGSYLRAGEPLSDEATAFGDFPGLDQIFAEGKLALWRNPHGPPLLWVPMFLTEDGVPLWVGRPVDPSPIEQFRDALMARVLSIILVLVLVVLLMAHWLANRAERFGQELTSGIESILRDRQPQWFAWKGPQEVRELGHQLNALAHHHAEHIATERQHTRELEQSNRYKSEFLANVSHELRTPLNSILLLSKMLAAQESGLDNEQRRQAQVINEAGRDLRTMIDNILDISRIEAGPVTVSLEWVDIAPMLAELAELMRPPMTQKGLVLRLDIGAGAPERIYTDRGKLRQILKNFLSNAAKFTDTGTVTIAVGMGTAERPLAIAVADTGIGIPPGKEEIIFEAFQQADGSTRRRYGGTGLGLSISRELAQLLGGEIQVESSLGEGSRFTLLLPTALDPNELESVEILEDHAAPPERKPPAAPAAEQWAQPPPKRPSSAPAAPATVQPPSGNRWVLLVERDVQCLVTATSQLESMGVRVQTAADADEALETLQEEPECPLLLMSASASAEETCATIKRINDGATGAEPPIYVIGDLDEAERERCRSAGAVGFLAKPLDRAALAALLDGALVQTSRHTSGAAAREIA
ncbi:MAG: response regulator [Thiohalocapsa sp.]|uniref:ATP-binding response regulator n=1 Tax=Thiohalocapsa sp. TaxID=2497641 RepID=UPI0025D4DC56|nr:ATP-binding protein [Thiohalocapsa sp.]MCG6939928.1 response regulator [Thiohalocapsa sp.]